MKRREKEIENYLLFMTSFFSVTKKEKSRKFYFFTYFHLMIRFKMVNSKKYDILERYRNFLENNLVLTDNFLRWFKEKRVLPDFILDDIQVCLYTSFILFI